MPHLSDHQKANKETSNTDGKQKEFMSMSNVEEWKHI